MLKMLENDCTILHCTRLERFKIWQSSLEDSVSRQNLFFGGDLATCLQQRRSSYALTIVILCLMFFGQVTWGCFYSSYSLNTEDNTQTSLEDVLLDRITEAEKARGISRFYANELAKLEKQYSQRRTDPDFLRDYGYLLHITGNTPRALAVWEEALKLRPNDYALLCNLGTVHQILGRTHYEKAREYLARAVKLKPGFRHGAEELHLRLLEHLRRQSENENHIRENLVLPELNEAWNGRKDPPNKFVAPGVTRETLRGLTELLRQFPKQGDTWMVLGMLLESEGKWREARLAYQRALKFGCGMTEELRDYFTKYQAFAEKKNPVRVVGWMVFSVFVLMILALLGPRILGIVQAVVEDIQDVKRRQSSRPSRRQHVKKRPAGES